MTDDERGAVVDVCNRLHLAVDEQDWSALGAVLADHVDMNDGSTHRTRDQVIELYRRLSAGAVSQHLVGGHVVAIDRDRAACTAQSLTTWTFGDGTRVTKGNTYGYRLTRSDPTQLAAPMPVMTGIGAARTVGEWRIDGRWTRPVWSDGEDPRDVAAIQKAWSDELR